MRQYDTARRVIADRFPNVTSVQTVHRPALLGTDLAVTRVIPAHLLESLVVIARGPNHCAYLDGECTVTFTTRVLREPQSYFDPAPGTPIEEVVRHEETVSIGSWDGDWVYRHVLGSIPPQPGDYIIEVTASRAGVSSGLIHRIRASPY
jgi:hypothetical protein